MSSSWISLYKRIFSIAPNISVQKLPFCDSTCLPEWTSVVLLSYTQNSFIHRVGFCSSAVSLAEKNSTPLLLQVQNCQFHGVTPRTATAKNNKNNNSNNSNNNNNKNNNNKNNNNNSKDMQLEKLFSGVALSKTDSHRSCFNRAVLKHAPNVYSDPVNVQNHACQWHGWN